MLDWQRFTQQSTSMIAHSERKRFTGHIECRVHYHNAVPRRSTLRKLTCAVLCREPVADRNRLLLPAEMIREMESEMPKNGLPNESSEISVKYLLFEGSVVAVQTELIQNL